jgi:dTDP-4-dehydrorhamnose reductase
MKKKILIIGSLGTLGKKLTKDLKLNKKIIIKTLAKKKADYCFNLENFKKLDKIFSSLDFDYVINCAAYTNLKYCEKNYKKIKKINTLLPQLLSRDSLAYNFKYVHISTDHIYISKENIGNSERAQVGWHNKYSKSKYLAEKKVITNSKSLIVRTNFIGNKSNKKSFIYWLNKSYNTKKKIYLFHDMYTSTVDLHNFSKILIKLMFNNSHGVFNVGCNEILSKKDFALKYIKKIKKKINYTSVSSNDKKFSKVKRGKFLGLNINKVENELKIKMPNSNQVIKNIINENTRY